MDRLLPGDVIALLAPVQRGPAAGGREKEDAGLRLFVHPAHPPVAGIEMIVAGEHAVHSIPRIEENRRPVPAE